MWIRPNNNATAVFSRQEGKDAAANQSHRSLNKKIKDQKTPRGKKILPFLIKKDKKKHQNKK